MSKFLNLLTDELRRAKWFYLALIIGVAVLELSLVAVNLINALQPGSVLTSKLNLHQIFSSSLFPLIIGGVVIAMLLYCLYTWLREWAAHDKFIYRLLLLPGSRVSIAYAKLASILLMIAGLVLVQIAVFSLTNFIGSLLPQVFTVQPWYAVISQGYSLSLLYMIMPLTPAAAILGYGFGLNFLTAFFNLCILFFSFRSHGYLKTFMNTAGVIIVNVLSYSAAFFILFSWAHFTAFETFLYIKLVHIIIGLFNLWVMHFLMNRYISV